MTHSRKGKKFLLMIIVFSQPISQHVQLNTACQQLFWTINFNVQEVLRQLKQNVGYVDFTSCSCLMHCCTKDLSCRGRASLIFSVPPNPDMMLLRGMPAPLVLQIFERNISMSFLFFFLTNTASHFWKILYVYRAPKKLVLLSEETEFVFGTLSLPNIGCLLKIEIKH